MYVICDLCLSPLCFSRLLSSASSMSNGVFATTVVLPLRQLAVVAFAALGSMCVTSVVRLSLPGSLTYAVCAVSQSVGRSYHSNDLLRACFASPARGMDRQTPFVISKTEIVAS